MKFNSGTFPSVLVFCGFIQIASCCRISYWAFGSQCIRFFELELSNRDALFLCTLEGSRIPTLTTQEIFEFVSIRMGSSSNTTFWIKSSLEATQPSVPNNETRSCFIYAGSEVKDAPCNSLHGVMCAYDKPHFNPIDNCLRGLTEHSFIGEETGSCVYRTAVATMREKADEMCSSNGGRFLDLDEIMRDGVSAFNKHKVMMNDRWRYWTSLTANSSGVWWPSGEPLQLFIPFIPGNGTCVTVSFNLEDSVKTELLQTECRDHAYVICGVTAAAFSTIATSSSTLPEPASCRPPWRLHPSKNECYWETSVKGSRSTWEEALQTCQAYGAELASFHSMDDETWSLQFLSADHKYWIGLHLDHENETYKWTDGSPLDYQNWAPGQPNHLDKRLRCVAFDSKWKYWISSLCGIITGYICKKPTSQFNSGAVTPSPVLPRKQRLIPCDLRERVPTSFYFQGYCYKMPTSIKGWHLAKQHCRYESSSLVSVHTDEEVGFLLKLLHETRGILGTRVWIGMHTVGSGKHTWIDSTPVDYTYWDEGEPNNVLNREDCVSMYISHGLWNDENCNNAMGFICKKYKDANISTTPSSVRNTTANLSTSTALVNPANFSASTARTDGTDVSKSTTIINGADFSTSATRTSDPVVNKWEKTVFSHQITNYPLAGSVALIVLGLLLVISSIGIAFWVFRPFYCFHGRCRLRSNRNYVNALYNVDSSSMVFQDPQMELREKT